MQSRVWGRNGKVSFLNNLLCMAIFLGTPMLVIYYINTALRCDSNLVNGISCLFSGELFGIYEYKMESLLNAIIIVVIWVTFQLILAVFPDIIHKIYPYYKGGVKEGLTSPGGCNYKYNINGLQAWLISLLAFATGSYLGWINVTVVYDNWGNILLVTAIFAYILATISYIKAHTIPTNFHDLKFTNSKFYDYFMGIELNPRTGPIDWKLFFNGRPGIIGWSIINLSFAAAQYNFHGYITNSMVLVNLLQTLYIGYFFYREAWYLKTLDISHDHFGWMFSFGDLVWLPAMYTLQSLYLVNNPIDLSFTYFLFVLLFGCFGFYIFASSNNEKDKFRSTGKIDITTETIPCTYRTSNGEVHRTQLLISGWWGTCRHINYTGDIMLSLAYSLACGTINPFPYFYVIYLTMLLLHRSNRDHIKCQDKYGPSWDIYCRCVPYRFIPYVV